MKKHISLVVLAGLFSAVSLQTMQASDVSSSLPEFSKVSSFLSNKAEWLNNVSVQSVKDSVKNVYFAYPKTVQASAAAVVVGLTIWKCSWVRKKLGLEKEETTRATEFDIEKLFANK